MVAKVSGNQFAVNSYEDFATWPLIGSESPRTTAIDLIYDIMRTSIADTVITLTRDECPGGLLLAWYSYSLVLGNNGWGFELLKRDRIVGSSYNNYIDAVVAAERIWS